MSEHTVGPDIDLDAETVLDKKGERITEARAALIAQQTLSQIHRGRPSLTGRPHHSPQVSFRVPESVREQARARAEAEGTTISHVARDALVRYLAS